MSATDTLAAFVANLKGEELPAEVQEAAARCLMDNLACALGASITESGRRWLALPGGSGPCTLLGSGRTVILEEAVYLNGNLANLLDFDDTRGGHPGSTVIPTGLAVAEQYRCSSADLLAAIVVGYEVQVRLFRAFWPSRARMHLFPKLTLQTFGAAATAGRLLNLNEQQMAHAFGIAATLAPLPKAISSASGKRRPWYKGYLGWSARTGLQAALLARMGQVGPRGVLDGEDGLAASLGTDRFGADALVQDLGVTYEILKVAFKPYPSCRWTHAALDALRNIREAAGVAAEDVEEVVIHLPPPFHEWLDWRTPASVTDAQFSLPFLAALVLYQWPEAQWWKRDDVVTRPDLLALSERVVLLPDPGLLRPEDQSRTVPARVSVRTRNGAEHRALVAIPRGEVSNPLTPGELKGKWDALTVPVLGEQGAEKLAQAVAFLGDNETAAIFCGLSPRGSL
ncbi:MmgE/PrpD family protein [Geochorda subterranea]|uniref:MmgE/PrpD family protein n=1 Tax=Geochorda subterranea TaxID=3109564 RepID=A0ABZ1BRM1_9FIRM|nr:MmgE/PrpD family protein [Limnochorda sp. LNt]WRP15246.1 MmgE/PrpD family protein [Limnochorda sp. LNt]